MAKILPISLLALCLLPHFFLAKCSSPLVPAIYVFGDSLVDSGNNDYLNTLAKANYYPYGIDFPAGTTGRFTNGRTVADFIAEYLGLPFAPPYMGLSEDQKSKTTTGMNYASGTAGILQDSGKAFGRNLALPAQVELFQDIVNNYLPKSYKNNTELLEYLSKSILLVDIGSNDYLENYLQPIYDSSQLYNPVQFAGILVKDLQQYLEDLYNLGARKFLVFNIAPIGCTPDLMYSSNTKSGCAENYNQLVSLYNEGLANMLQDLGDSLHGSTFVQAQFYASSYITIQNYYEYGFSSRGPCCDASNLTSLCVAGIPPCRDRTTHVFYDEVHPSQQANFLFASGCFNTSSTYCTPINILQLTEQ